MNYFITSHHLTPHGRYELNKLTSLPMCGFIAQLVEQRTGNAEVTGSNSVEALIFFRLLLSNCLNWKIHCDDHSSLSYSIIITHIKLKKNNVCRFWLKAVALIPVNTVGLFETPNFSRDTLNPNSDPQSTLGPTRDPVYTCCCSLRENTKLFVRNGNQ